MDSGPIVIFRRAPKTLRRQAVREFARTLAARMTGERPFCCLVTTDDELQRLNRQFRGKDTPTDVLSFPASGADSIGDVAISSDRAAHQAAEFGHDMETEVRILMLHGVLHLLGHDHESDGGAMRRVEMRWRKELDLPAGLIERARS